MQQVIERGTGMTVEEAIKWLEYSKQGEIGKAVEAADMAIKALSQQTEYHGTEDMDGLYYCPICQQTTTVVKNGKCPKCGATMDELSTREQTEDAISRQAVLEIINDIRDCISVEGYCAILERMKKLPPVNPRPKTGHWKYAEQLQVEICSCCSCIKGNYFFSDIEVPIKFCPNCGAWMVEPQESEGKDGGV